MCIKAISESEDREEYYTVLMTKQTMALFPESDFVKCNHKDILTLGYIIYHNGKQISDRYWINKMNSSHNVLIETEIATELKYIKEFRERIEMNNLD